MPKKRVYCLIDDPGEAREHRAHRDLDGRRGVDHTGPGHLPAYDSSGRIPASAHRSDSVRRTEPVARLEVHEPWPHLLKLGLSASGLWARGALFRLTPGILLTRCVRCPSRAMFALTAYVIGMFGAAVLCVRPRSVVYVSCFGACASLVFRRRSLGSTSSSTAAPTRPGNVRGQRLSHPWRLSTYPSSVRSCVVGLCSLRYAVSHFSSD